LFAQAIIAVRKKQRSFQTNGDLGYIFLTLPDPVFQVTTMPRANTAQATEPLRRQVRDRGCPWWGSSLKGKVDTSKVQISSCEVDGQGIGLEVEHKTRFGKEARRCCSIKPIAYAIIAPQLSLEGNNPTTPILCEGTDPLVS